MCWYSNIWIVEYSNFEVLKYLNVQIFEYLLNIEMLLEDALPHWQLARGCTLRAEPVGWECVWKQQQQQSESIVILIVNNNVRMLSKTTTINASFFTYLFVNSGGIFLLLWGGHGGMKLIFSLIFISPRSWRRFCGGQYWSVIFRGQEQWALLDPCLDQRQRQDEREKQLQPLCLHPHHAALQRQEVLGIDRFCKIHDWTM